MRVNFGIFKNPVLSFFLFFAMPKFDEEPVKEAEKDVYAIVHRQTRIVVSYTVDFEQSDTVTYEKVLLPRDIDLSVPGRYRVLQSNGTLRPATEEEIERSDLDPQKRRERAVALKGERTIAARAVLEDASVPETVKEFVRTLSNLY